MTDKEKIKTFAQKRLNENMCKAQTRGCLHTIAANEDKELISYIDSLPKEQVNKNLEEEKPVLHGWVARDENGDLRIFEVMPKRSSDDNKWWDRDYQCTLLDRNLFPDLKWEDEPVYVKLPIIVED